MTDKKKNKDCYDEITFKCPWCKTEMNTQSKSGDCNLQRYSYKKVPFRVAMDCNRRTPFECSNCGRKWKFITKPVELRVIEYIPK